MRSPGTSAAPAPSATCEPDRYEVEQAGDVVNEAKEPIARVSPGDVFVRDSSAGDQGVPYRYHGTVEGSGVTGYVMKEKLRSSCS